MKTIDILLLIFLAAMIGLAVRTMVRMRRHGKGCLGCCENCAGCGAEHDGIRLPVDKSRAMHSDRTEGGEKCKP